MANTIASALGLPEYSGDVIHELGADRLFLDGLVSSGTLDKPLGTSKKANKIILIFFAAALSRGTFS
jgi:hypothetical protein